MKLEARELSFRYDNGNRQILNKMRFWENDIL